MKNKVDFGCLGCSKFFQQHQKAERFSLSAPLSTAIGPLTAARTASCIVSLMRIFSLAELSMNRFAWILRASSSPSSTEIKGLRGLCRRSDLVAENGAKVKSPLNYFRPIIDFLLIAYPPTPPESASYLLPWALASTFVICSWRKSDWKYHSKVWSSWRLCKIVSWLAHTPPDLRCLLALSCALHH